MRLFFIREPIDDRNYVGITPDYPKGSGNSLIDLASTITHYFGAKTASLLPKSAKSAQTKICKEKSDNLWDSPTFIPIVDRQPYMTAIFMYVCVAQWRKKCARRNDAQSLLHRVDIPGQLFNFFYSKIVSILSENNAKK